MEVLSATYKVFHLLQSTSNQHDYLQLSSHNIACMCPNVPGQCNPFVLINTVPGTGLHGSHKKISPDLLVAILYNVASFSALCFLASQGWDWNPGIAQASQVFYY